MKMDEEEHIPDFNGWLKKKLIPDGTLIDRIDNALLGFNTKIASKWQDKTYKNKKELEKRLFYGSAAISAGYIASAQNYGPAPMFVSSMYLGYKGMEGIDSMLGFDDVPEDIKEKIEEDTPRFIKCAHLSGYAVTVWSLFQGIGYLTDGIMHNNLPHIKKGTEELAFGASTFLFTTAVYISRVKLKDPPKKPEKKPFLERVKETFYGLAPQPTPEPAKLSF